jgi:hypothetical protein
LVKWAWRIAISNGKAQNLVRAYLGYIRLFNEPYLAAILQMGLIL